MKTVLRLGVICLAFVVMGGATWFWVQNGGAPQLPGASHHFEGERGNGFPPAGEGRFEGGRGERGGLNLFGLNTVVKNLVIVGGLTLLVICLSVVWRAVRPWLFPPRAAASPTPSSQG